MFLCLGFFEVIDFRVNLRLKVILTGLSIFDNGGEKIFLWFLWLGVCLVFSEYSV